MPTRKQTTLTVTAEGLGTALGNIAARVRAFNQQRSTLLKELAAITHAAQAMLNDLGHAPTVDGTGAKRGRPKGYKMSDETRAKLRAAWKRRKKASGNQREHTKPQDERANIRSKSIRRP